jgi:Cyclophilin type peptidyl-prolyl cis-trans isomerase/CLD
MVLASVYFLVFLSWSSHYGYTKKHEALWAELEYDIADQQEASAQTRIHANKIKNQVLDLQQRLSTLEKTQHALKHELRMLVEMQIEGVNMTMNSSSSSGSSSSSNANNNPMDGFIERWMDQRQVGLLHRIAHLENHVQNISKHEVLEKYGPGPHRVQFKVQVETTPSNQDRLQPIETDDAMWHNMISKPLKSFVKTSKSKVTRSFVVQLAPLNEVPHAIHFFLDMIQNDLWDDALFLHHEQVQHVMAAAPMDYQTHDIRYDALNAMGWQGLGFPEFSKSMPHDKYTLGFADRGPTFYINTMNNSDIHGPGGQGHHVLPNDADPCFGRVVEGQDVVDALIVYGLKADNKLKINGAHPWKDSNHSWSRLVSAKLL